MKQRWPEWILAMVACLLMAAGFSPLAERMSNSVFDAMVKEQAKQRSLPAEIVQVTIDQKSLEAMNELAGSWPWPRAIHGELVDLLKAQEPRAIVLDLLFNEPDTWRPDSDAYFAEVARETGNLYLPTLLLPDGSGAPAAAYPPALHLQPLPDARETVSLPLLVPLVVPPEAWRGGTINFLADNDGIGRRYPLWQVHNGWQIPSLPLRLAQDFNWPLPSGNTWLLNWYGETVRQYSYSDLFFQLSEQPETLREALAGKIVIVGATAPGLGDLRPTPLSKTYPGMQILATAIANLAEGDWLEETRWGLWLYLLVPLLLFAGIRRLHLLPVALALLVVSAAVVAGQYLLLRHGVVMHGVVPLLAAWLMLVALVTVYWFEERALREQAINLFGRFLDPRVVKGLVQGKAIQDAQVTQARDITILFSDIRGFTSLSEKRSPEAVVALLNDYFSRQVQVIFKTRGTLDKFIGDAIMAFWGAPVEDPDHAFQAVTAALAMVDELERFCHEAGAEAEGFDIGIGIHTGPAVVGFIGSDDRLDYTAIGDSVNLSSRIEGKTKGVARVLVSETTRAACENTHPGFFEFVDHGEVQVKGREQGVRLYEPRRKEARN